MSPLSMAPPAGGCRFDVATHCAWLSALMLILGLMLPPVHGQEGKLDLGAVGGVFEELPFVCPMDPDVRAKTAGVCPRCGMKLVLGLPVSAEYPVLLSTKPNAVDSGAPVRLSFEVLEPVSGSRQTEFEVVHEKLFHLFWVSHGLEIFRHEHPVLGEDGIFRIDTIFDKPGSYRLMGDFYPTGGTPQMVPMTLTTRGFDEPLETLAASLQPDLAPKRGKNVTVALRPDPPKPIAGLLTLLFFELNTSRGLQKYLGAWAHMLAVKDDLVTMIHGHPSIADGGKLIQMNVIFPGPGMYRVWVQVQRKRKVSTLPFTVEVSALPNL